VEAIVERFAAEYLAKHVRPTSRAVMLPALRRVTARWQGRRINSITRAEVKLALADIGEKHGPAAGVKARMVVSRMFSWALEQDVLDHSPATALGRLPKATKRQRAFNDAEIRRLWQATDNVDHWLRAFLRILLLTGQRRIEVAGLRWSEIDGDRWLLPDERTKNHRTHLIPLTPTVLELLGTMERAGPHVFTSDGKTYRQNFDKAKRQIDAALEADGQDRMADWTLHDLRRSAASGMARIGIPSANIERVLNHTPGQLIQTYQVYDGLAEKQAALARWESHVLGVVEDRPAAVVTLPVKNRFKDNPIATIRDASGRPLPRKKRS
jgi:integrase